jgi:hypothetical protein
LNAERAEGDEEGEGSFRSIGGGTEGVEAKDSDAGRRSETLFAVLIAGQRFAEQEIAKGHRSIMNPRARPPVHPRSSSPPAAREGRNLF